MTANTFRSTANTLLAITILMLGVLACGRTAPRELNLYPTETPDPTQTPYLVEITSTPANTSTPVYIVVTPDEKLCVNAVVAVHLRPSPNDQNYPIAVVPNGTVLLDLGGRSGSWYFVSMGTEQGWVHKNYLSVCEN
jgi:hypothetical protein